MNDFPHKLDEWIEKEIEVPAFEPVLDEKNNRVELKKTIKKATQRTLYSDSKPRKVVCNNHKYYPLDKGKYIFRCMNCDWRIIAPPITFKFNEKTGRLTHRKTGMKA